MYRFLPPLLAILIVVAWDGSNSHAQDYWQLALEDLPPLDFPDAATGGAKKSTAASQPLPSPTPSVGGLRPEDVQDIDDAPANEGSPSASNRDTGTSNREGQPGPATDGTGVDLSELDGTAQDPLFAGTENFQIRDFLAPVFSSGDWYQRGHTYVHAAAHGLWRSAGKPKLLARDLSSVLTGVTLGGQVTDISTRHAGFRFEPGLGLTIGRYLGRDSFNRDASVEFGFVGFLDWQTTHVIDSASDNGLFTALNKDGPGGSGTIKGPLGANIPVGFVLIPGFDLVDQQEFHYSSDFNSFEFNVRLSHRLGRDRMVAMPDGTWSRQLASGGIPSFFAGLRYVRIEERLLWLSEEIHGGTNGKGSYDIQTHNALVGFQFGGNYKWVTKNWSAGAAGKVGAYVNFADSKRVVHGEGGALIPGTNVSPIGQDYQYATNLPGIQFTPPGGSPQSQASWDFTSRERASVISPFLETELFSQYNVNPNLSLRFAWNMFWINGLAMAPNQITFEAAEARINMGGNVFFTGLALSGEWVW